MRWSLENASWSIENASWCLRCDLENVSWCLRTELAHREPELEHGSRERKLKHAAGCGSWCASMELAHPLWPGERDGSWCWRMENASWCMRMVLAHGECQLEHAR